MTFIKFFLICIFKNTCLAEIFTNFAENQKILNFAEFMEFVFSKSAGQTVDSRDGRVYVGKDKGLETD